MNDPKITIVTPSFNQGKYLEATINSILDQNYSNLEYFIIDGGSSDNSVNIIKKYEKYINYWISEKDGGQSEAINKGLRMATGDFISWINSDDLLHPGILVKIPSFFDSCNTGLIFGKSVSFGENLSEKTSRSDFDDQLPKILASVPFPQPASFFRRKVLEEQGLLDESLHFGMDYDLFVRIALNYEIRSIDEIVSLNRYHPASKTMSMSFNFALDWVKVFSRLVRSFDFTSNIIADLKSLNLYHYADDNYEVGNIFTKSDIEKAYLYFLQEQAQFYYGANKLQEARHIVRRIKDLNPIFYKIYNLHDINFRSKYIPVNLMRFFKFMRSRLSI